MSVYCQNEHNTVATSFPARNRARNKRPRNIHSETHFQMHFDRNLISNFKTNDLIDLEI